MTKFTGLITGLMVAMMALTALSRSQSQTPRANRSVGGLSEQAG